MNLSIAAKRGSIRWTANAVSGGSPGAADSALTVGAVDSADKAAYFTSQGPRAGDNALKPDLSAPGVDILAARSQLTSGQGYYTSMSGTSMATPHIAGVAALLANQPVPAGARVLDSEGTAANVDYVRAEFERQLDTKSRWDAYIAGDKNAIDDAAQREGQVHLAGADLAVNLVRMRGVSGIERLREFLEGAGGKRLRL